MHLASVDIATPNDFDVAAQMLPNEQRRWRDFSYGSEMGYMIKPISISVITYVVKLILNP